MDLTANYCDKAVAESDSNASNCENEIKQALNDDEFRQVGNQIDCNNEETAKHFKQKIIRKYNALKYGKNAESSNIQQKAKEVAPSLRLKVPILATFGDS